MQLTRSCIHAAWTSLDNFRCRFGLNVGKMLSIRTPLITDPVSAIPVLSAVHQKWFRRWFYVSFNVCFAWRKKHNPFTTARPTICVCGRAGGTPWGLPLMTSAKLSDFLTPSPPCPQIHATSLTELPYFVRFSTKPLSPLGAEVINGSPLALAPSKFTMKHLQSSPRKGTAVLSSKI